jgi:hypothetical protein
VADYYVRSTDGDNADSGATWALAKADLHTPTWAAGDRIFVSQVHAQTTGASITIALNGTAASPTQILGVDDAAEPPTSLSTAPSVTTTGAFSITVSGSCYVEGLNFFVGTGASGNQILTMGSNVNGIFQRYRNCTFQVTSTDSDGQVRVGVNGSNQPSVVEWHNCHVKFSQASQGVYFADGSLFWSGGSVLSGSTGITALFNSIVGDTSMVFAEDLDLSNCATTMNIFGGGAKFRRGVIRNCRLPASWSGSLGSVGNPAYRLEMHNCDSADTNYRLWIEDYYGSIRSETVIVRTGGASDGTTTLAWKMVTGADVEFPALRLYSPEIVVWNDTVGSAVTVTIHIVHDSQGAGSGGRLRDDEVCVEVSYLGTSGYPQGSNISDAKVLLASAANQTDSTETWTTTGLTSPVKQQLEVTFTPQEKGFLHIHVVGLAASKTIYICPKAELS